MLECPQMALFLLAALLLTHAPPALADDDAHGEVRNVWVQVAPPHRGIVRALTEGARCPVVRFDGRRERMRLRAAPDRDFDIRVCESEVPEGTRRIRVAGRDLKPVSLRPRRIAVLGDTGCRLKKGATPDAGFQGCNDPNDWEFAKVAKQIAEWKPDLIIQTGDYIYREQPCPDTANCRCAGSPYNSAGLRLETWNADYFDVAGPMLEAAPMVFVRGDHEKCERAGGGFFRFLYPLAQDVCSDFSAPYALDFEGLQLVVMDTIYADDTVAKPLEVIAQYSGDFEVVRELVTRDTWLLSHRPIWAFRPFVKAEDLDMSNGCRNLVRPHAVVTSKPKNVSVQAALAASSLRGRLPKGVELVLTGHVHLSEALGFTGGRPPEMLSGRGGTLLLPAPDESLVGERIPDDPLTGEYVIESLIVVEDHGFMGLRKRRHGWRVEMLGAEGQRLARCRFGDKPLRCEKD